MHCLNSTSISLDTNTRAGTGVAKSGTQPRPHHIFLGRNYQKVKGISQIAQESMERHIRYRKMICGRGNQRAQGEGTHVAIALRSFHFKYRHNQKRFISKLTLLPKVLLCHCRLESLFNQQLMVSFLCVN